MTGVSVDQWRASIGLFHSKTISKKYVKGCNDYDGLLITDHLRKMLCILEKPLEILFSLLLLFSYCTMIVILFPIFLAVCLCLDHFILTFFTYPHLLQTYNFYLYPAQFFFVHKYYTEKYLVYG